MSLFKTEVCEYSIEIWKSVLGLDVQCVDGAPVFQEKEKILVGSVHITGSWNGRVSLHCPESLARRAAAIMFEVNEEETDSNHVQDALGELANMTGGNIKSLLPEPSFLSLPTVEESEIQSDLSEQPPTTWAAFRCRDHQFAVTIESGEQI